MKIDYPKKTRTHTEIQALLWQQLTTAGLDARLEVKASKARLDIVIFRDKEPRAIIECKSWSPRYFRNYRYQKARNQHQINRYRGLFGIPVFVCGCLASMKPAISFAKKCVSY
jgi:hypothetical protein